MSATNRLLLSSIKTLRERESLIGGSSSSNRSAFGTTSFTRAAAVLGLSLLFAAAFSCGSASAGVAPGSSAPNFSLTDTYGKQVSLADFKGKYVVLEWLNHGCPFVKNQYETGNMQRLQKELTAKGIIWLSVNSSAKGKQGHFPPAEANALTAKKGAAPTGVLLDPLGKVGRLYGAKTTPHMFVINPKGTIVYNGAIDDNSSSGKSLEEINAAKNYVRLALAQSMDNQPVSIASTRPYGCSVKYP